MRPILRPGTHVLSRAGGELQVGLDPARAVLLPDTDPVRRMLALLAAPAERAAYAADDLTATVDQLERHGLLVDERDLMPLLDGARGGTGHAAAALARLCGGRTAEAWRARTRWRGRVRGFGHPAGVDLPGDLGALLRDAGLADPVRDRADPVDTGVLVGVGEPHREELDEWIRAGTAHLVVRLTEGRAVIGPCVVPGRTACLRCVDAHRTDADPSWPLLVRQYAAASIRDRVDGAPEPVDPLLAALALAWAARDLATYVDGRRPSTWSATITVQPDLSELETRAWLRHPACCCTWD